MDHVYLLSVTIVTFFIVYSKVAWKERGGKGASCVKVDEFSKGFQKVSFLNCYLLLFYYFVFLKFICYFEFRIK